MLSLVFDTGFFIDVLQYSVNGDIEVVSEIGQQFLDIFYAEKSDSPRLNTPINRLCISLIKKIVTENLDTKDESQLAAAYISIKDSRAAQKDPITFTQIEKVLMGKRLSDKKVASIEKNIIDHLCIYKTMKLNNKLSNKTQTFLSSTNDNERNLIISEIEKDVKDFIGTYNNGFYKSKYTEKIDFSNMEQIKQALTVCKERKTLGIIKTGLQGLNNILGESKGITIGEFVGVIAMSHHHKTGTLMDICRWICTLNDPVPNNTGDPTIVFISLENDINYNTSKWYLSLYRNMFKENPPTTNEKDIALFVHNEFNKRGYKLIVLREQAHEFGYKQYKDSILELKKQGHDVQHVIIDYLTLFKIEEMGGNKSQNIKATMDMVKQFGQKEGFSTISGFQADSFAVSLNVGKGINPVKRYNRNVLADAKAIFDSLDIVIYQQIEENHRKEKYLTYCLGKFRGFDLYRGFNPFVAYKFSDFGILDDLYGTDQSVTDIYMESIEQDMDNSQIDLF